MSANLKRASSKVLGFTLVELIVSTAVISLIMVVLVAITGQTSQTWRHTTGKIEQFQSAREGFESMTRRISQATLNTYWAVHPPPPDVPKRYIRNSELRFISGQMSALGGETNNPTHGIFFQSPFGFVEDTATHGAMDNLLNTWGYFVEVGDDKDDLPPFLSGTVPPRWRSRLMEFSQPAEEMTVYGALNLEDKSWFQAALGVADRPVRRLADNVMALVILPKLSAQQEERRANNNNNTLLSPKYSYDSTKEFNEGNQGASDGDVNPQHQLPPVVLVTMIAIDETSAQRLNDDKPNDPQANLDLSDLFKEAARLEDNPATPTPGDGDLRALEQMLVDKKLVYRVFTSSVNIRGAKWTRSQAKTN